MFAVVESFTQEDEEEPYIDREEQLDMKEPSLAHVIHTEDYALLFDVDDSTVRVVTYDT